MLRLGRPISTPQGPASSGAEVPMQASEGTTREPGAAPPGPGAQGPRAHSDGQLRCWGPDDSQPLPVPAVVPPRVLGCTQKHIKKMPPRLPEPPVPAVTLLAPGGGSNPHCTPTQPSPVQAVCPEPASHCPAALGAQRRPSQKGTFGVLRRTAKDQHCLRRGRWAGVGAGRGPASSARR